MWGKKAALKEPASTKDSEVSTKDLVLSARVVYSSEDNKRALEIERLTGVSRNAIPEAVLCQFPLVVTCGDIFTKFKYAAQVNRFPSLQIIGRGEGIFKGYLLDSERLLYVGDIPPFALERLQLAQSVGIEKFTIHSNQPLPVRFEPCDPVLIGWAGKMVCEQHDAGWGIYHKSTRGIVVAMWDMEKEITT